MSLSPAELASDEAYIRQTRGPVVIGVTTMLIVLTSVAVAARVAARRMTRAKIATDDFLVFAAQIIFLGLATEFFFLVRYGIGRHAITLSADDAVAIGKLIFSLQITYSVLITVTKASILMLYRRIFTLNLKAFRICWWISVSLVLAYFVAIIIIACTQCTPISRLWSLTAPCQTSFVPAAIFGSINALTDLIILTLPLPMVWGLHLPRKQKIAVSATFLLGVLVVVISIVRVPYLEGGGPDFSWRAVIALIWTIIEPATAIICACLPVLRPLFIRDASPKSPRAQSSYRPFGPGSKSSSDRSNVSKWSYRPWHSSTPDDTQPFHPDRTKQHWKNQARMQHERVSSFSMESMQPERPQGISNPEV